MTDQISDERLAELIAETNQNSNRIPEHTIFPGWWLEVHLALTELAARRAQPSAVSVGDDLVERLNGWAVEIDNDGTPSQIGPTPDELREAASQLAAVTAEMDALERTRSLMARDWFEFCEAMEVTPDTQEAVACELRARATTAEAQLKAARDLVEQAFKDGVHYGTMVDVKNTDEAREEAWQISRSRAALNPKAPPADGTPA